jgi:hypothetical protein
MIETARLRLRDWTEQDSEPFYRIASDPRVMEFFPAPLSREESDGLIARIQARQAKHGFTFPNHRSFWACSIVTQTASASEPGSIFIFWIQVSRSRRSRCTLRPTRTTGKSR